MSSLIKKATPLKEKVSVSVKPYILPFYIIFSAVFIVYVAYSYANGIVYKSGITSGQEAGYQAGVQATLTQLMTQATQKCDVVTVSLGENQVNLINTACLQAPTQGQETQVDEGQ